MLQLIVQVAISFIMLWVKAVLLVSEVSHGGASRVINTIRSVAHIPMHLEGRNSSIQNPGSSLPSLFPFCLLKTVFPIPVSGNFPELA